MPKTKISEFSSTPASNTDIDSINIAEGCSPSGINDAIRELMSQLKDWQSGTSNDPYVVGSSGSLTLNQGTANGVAYLNGSKVVTSGSALTFDGTSFVVGGSTFPDGRIRLKQASDASKQKGLLIEAFADDSLLAIGYDGSAFTFNPTYNTTGAYKPMAWWVSGSEQMRLTSTGLGIGTSSPAQKLHVQKDQAAYTWARVDNQSSSASAYSGFMLGAFGNSWGLAMGSSAANSNALSFVLDAGSGNAEKMRLDSSGNLGLGVTPSAWNTLKAFQINQSSLASYANNTYLMNNVFYDGTNYKYINTSTAARYDLSNNTHIWYNAPSGTAGNAITFTQAMTLDASGNLGVGTTSPTYPLTIQANSSTQGIRLIGRASDNIANMSFVANNGSTEYAFINTGATYFAIGVNSAERARIDSSGNLIQSAPTTPPSLATNGTMVFNLTSNTNLRVSVRGSDGVTRTANITLA
jgi:hypothetical protein